MKVWRNIHTSNSDIILTTYFGAGLMETFIVIGVSEDSDGLALCGTGLFFSELPNVGRTEVWRSPKEIWNRLVALEEGVHGTQRNEYDGADTDKPTQRLNIAWVCV